MFIGLIAPTCSPSQPSQGRPRGSQYRCSRSPSEPCVQATTAAVGKETGTALGQGQPWTQSWVQLGKLAMQFQIWYSLLLARSLYKQINATWKYQTKGDRRRNTDVTFLYFSQNSFPISNEWSLCLGFLYAIPYHHFSCLENMLECWLPWMNEADYNS